MPTILLMSSWISTAAEKLWRMPKNYTYHGTKQISICEEAGRRLSIGLHVTSAEEESDVMTVHIP